MTQKTDSTEALYIGGNNPAEAMALLTQYRRVTVLYDGDEKRDHWDGQHTPVRMKLEPNFIGVLPPEIGHYLNRFDKIVAPNANKATVIAAHDMLKSSGRLVAVKAQEQGSE